MGDALEGFGFGDVDGRGLADLDDLDGLGVGEAAEEAVRSGVGDSVSTGAGSAGREERVAAGVGDADRVTPVPGSAGSGPELRMPDVMPVTMPVAVPSTAPTRITVASIGPNRDDDSGECSSPDTCSLTSW